MTQLFCLLLALLVRNQAEFDRIPAVVSAALSEGKQQQIDIHIAPGVYFYGDGFLDLKDVEADGTAFRISGEDAVLVASDGGDRSYSLEKGYVDLETLSHVDIRTGMRHARFWPLKVPFRKNLYALRCRETPVPKDSVDGLTLRLTQWYISANYPVEKITRSHIYFRREKKYETGMLSELRYGRCFPRYLFCRPAADTLLYPCRSVRFLNVERAALKSVSLEGLRFLGNGDGTWLLSFRDVLADSVNVARCHFEGIRSGVVLSEGTDNCRFLDSFFTKCYRSCIYIKDSSRNVLIQGNRFIDNGLQVTNAPVVNCKGGDFLIRDNYFEDFSYSAIGLGHHYLETGEQGLSGIVEENEICMSDAFRRGVFRELIDSGAIYVWTLNNDLTIRNNYIHDIGGPHGNRGILCDDGACNVKIYGNRVVRVKGSYCIDLRMFRRVARKTFSKSLKPNTGNVMRDNIVDGRCRFHIRRGDAASFKGENIQL